MKIKVEPGRVVRLTATKNTSMRGGEYDLAPLKLSDEATKRILALDGVSEIKAVPTPAPKASKKEGDA
jgi:hypothetical protein